MDVVKSLIYLPCMYIEVLSELIGVMFNFLEKKGKFC